MTIAALPRSRSVAESLALGAALAAAVAVRVAVAGPGGPSSIGAGLVFAAILALYVGACRPVTRVDRRTVVLGLAGAAVLVVPALLVRGVAAQHPGGSYLRWSVAVAMVAATEEAFLRGALFAALDRWRGTDVAVVGAAVAFAALHVPLYGWHVLPLDLAVGLLLGALRVASGSWTAPAIAHVGADLAGWWLV
ncbi:MAG: CPBP family intramembrane metalloprotease [Frankiales bacterium]|nr:CPBP family intramembrane metalloprotease [Frankiales bacterium]